MASKRGGSLGRTPLNDDPLWYKDAIIYELHVKAFRDTSDDGIGDFRGLIEKLDYLEGLGVTAVWLLPFYPSPLRDDGYDIADYFSINPDYGSLQDFRAFLREAHNRGIRVITELVVNHTSDKHPWFQRARTAKPDSVWRNFYVWSETPEKYKDARIIFTDSETSNWTWDPVAKAYYWHRFYSHQPDLNYDNPQVEKEVFRVLDFWFEMGVDGLRLDAVPYIYEREGTNCENLPETYRFLERLRAHVDARFKNRMLLAEANQWPEDAAAYFGKGDQCHMNFHFPLMPRMFMGLRMEDRFPIVDILEQTPSIPESCQWAMFLRNHDELTLEMVTDEERDYMYRVYAKDPKAKINLGIRRRLAPLLDNNRRKIELMNFLLFSLPGTPVIYYGDEIGMGDNYYLGDRDGVRTPMQWSPDRNSGFSSANPQKLYLPVIIDPEYHHQAINVETQERNLSSLLWWMKRVIAMRKRFKAFGRGSLQFLSADNPKVLAFLRKYRDEAVLVVINLSRFAQVVRLDLSSLSGCVPEEVFSQNRFPVIRESPYVITLGSYDHHWLLLVPEVEGAAGASIRSFHSGQAPAGKWPVDAERRNWLEKEALPRYLRTCRWFGGKGRGLKQVRILEDIPVDSGTDAARLVPVEVSYTEGTPEIYLLPMAFAGQSQAREVAENFPQSVIAEFRFGEEEGVLYDAIYNLEFHRSLLSIITKRKKISGKQAQLIGNTGKHLRTILAENGASLESRVLKAEQSNTSVVYDDLLFLKLYRRPDEGVNPDLEITRFLSERTNFRQVPLFAGSVELKSQGADPVTIALLQSYTANQGDGWSFTLSALDRFFERVLAAGAAPAELTGPPPSVSDHDDDSRSKGFEELIEGFYLEMVRLLGRRTGELHLALASSPADPDFAPEPFSLLYRKSVFQSMRSSIRRAMPLLRNNLHRIPGPFAQDAEDVLAAEEELIAMQRRVVEKEINGTKIRVHGDYHLGQVLFTGKDFVIIDFEGEPARPVSERRLKRSALRDVAGMMRSFHYAAYSALLKPSNVRDTDIPLLEDWIEPWYRHVSGAFLDSYFGAIGDAAFVPNNAEEREILVEALLLDKAIYELSYEVNNRPDWVVIPVRGIKQILGNHRRRGN